MAWADWNDAATLAEDWTKSVIRSLLDTNIEDLEELQRLKSEVDKHQDGIEQADGADLLQSLQAVLHGCDSEGGWARLSYSDALQELEAADSRKPGRFDQAVPAWGGDLAPEHERFLAQFSLCGGRGKEVEHQWWCLTTRQRAKRFT